MAMDLKKWIVLVVMVYWMVSLSMGARPSAFMEMAGDEKGSFGLRLSVVLELITALPKGSTTPSGPSTCTHYSYNGEDKRCPLKLNLVRRGSLEGFHPSVFPPPLP